MHKKEQMRGFLPLSCDGISPRLALSGELVMQTNEHTKLCLIKQCMMLTFTQRELFHVSAATMAGGAIWRGYKRIQRAALSPAAPLQQFCSTQRREREKLEGGRRG